MKLGSFTESQAKTDHNNFQTSCLGQKHFVFIMVIKALDQQFNLPFPHPLARGQKTKQGRGGKREKKKADPIQISQTFCHCVDTAGMNMASEKSLSTGLLSMEVK